MLSHLSDRLFRVLPRLLPPACLHPLRAGMTLARRAVRWVPAIRRIDVGERIRLQQDKLFTELHTDVLDKKHDIALKALKEHFPADKLADVLRAMDPAVPTLSSPDRPSTP